MMLYRVIVIVAFVSCALAVIAGLLAGNIERGLQSSIAMLLLAILVTLHSRSRF